MKITELFGLDAAPITAFPPSSAGAATLTTPDITGITADSRQVQPGFLFAAMRGAQTDGRRFAAAAIESGAAAILTDSAAALGLDEQTRRGIAVIEDPNPALALAKAASRFFPRRPTVIVGVTGTNGKTSVAHFTRELWQALGHPAASLGTLGVVTETERAPGSLTTPDPVALHRTLSDLAARGIERAAIEASSHGLAQYRLDGLQFAAAAFTNLTRDHLDYHGDMAAYLAAKQRLFADLLAADGTAVLNADGAEFAQLAALAAGRGIRVISYGMARSADLRLARREPRHDGQRLELNLYGQPRTVELRLIGDFQAMNALAALGLVLATGAEVARTIPALAALTTVPGRMQFVGQKNGAAVFVDYAHTPDALTTVLAAARPHAAGRLIVLFGAGGDRDSGKRPLMGAAATAAADVVYVTDDNPRKEEPAAIRRAVLDAAPGAIEIGDRRRAIREAIGALRPGDVLVLAGKGHETGQIVGDVVLPFEDAAVAAEALGASGTRPGAR
ncbi:MAG: UDP-N-acetylmuramoyl-L-alanyl-D-glutamate--2,6-diaminopimelate ligase [Alphaproteobacteria bacterium]|nr:UDP-N-acetylmuramoyl-L-alanyl-D-glutamate--2,6-diaminopimelate ligase [Alphaproteobacteria bacterium]